MSSGSDSQNPGESPINGSLDLSDNSQSDFQSPRASPVCDASTESSEKGALVDPQGNFPPEDDVFAASLFRGSSPPSSAQALREKFDIPSSVTIRIPRCLKSLRILPLITLPYMNSFSL